MAFCFAFRSMLKFQFCFNIYSQNTSARSFKTRIIVTTYILLHIVCCRWCLTFIENVFIKFSLNRDHSIFITFMTQVCWMSKLLTKLSLSFQVRCIYYIKSESSTQQSILNRFMLHISPWVQEDLENENVHYTWVKCFFFSWLCCDIRSTNILQRGYDIFIQRDGTYISGWWKIINIR